MARLALRCAQAVTFQQPARELPHQNILKTQYTPIIYTVRRDFSILLRFPPQLFDQSAGPGHCNLADGKKVGDDHDG
jgi:hypothetical protein